MLLSPQHNTCLALSHGSKHHSWPIARSHIPRMSYSLSRSNTKGLGPGNQPLVCYSNKLESNAASKEKESKVSTDSEKDSDDATEEFIQKVIEDTPPAAVTAGINIIEGLFVTSLALLLGDLLSIDPTSALNLNPSACWLAVQTSIPLVLLMAAVTLVPNGPRHTEKRLDMFSKAEDDSVLSSTVTVDLDFLVPGESTSISAMAAAVRKNQLVEATRAPTSSALQVFRWWVTKPWFFQFTAQDMAVITASSSLKLAASELMARGLIVAVLANWLHDSVANAPPDSWLFWPKLLRLNGPELYRWFGTLLVALASLWAVSKEADRIGLWARAVLFNLAKESTQSSQEDAQSATEGAAQQGTGSQQAAGTAVSSSSSSPSMAEAAQTVTTAVLTAAATSAAMSARSSMTSSAAVATSINAATAVATAAATTSAAGGSTSGTTVSTSATTPVSHGEAVNSIRDFARSTKTGNVMKPVGRASSTSKGSTAEATTEATTVDTNLQSQQTVADSSLQQEQRPEPDVGMGFTGANLKSMANITLTRNEDGRMEVTYSEEVKPGDMIATKEDRLVWALACGFGGLQVAQLAFVYGTTGSLAATFLARVCIEVTGNVIMYTNAQNGSPKLANAN